MNLWSFYGSIALIYWFYKVYLKIISTLKWPKSHPDPEASLKPSYNLKFGLNLLPRVHAKQLTRSGSHNSPARRAVRKSAAAAVPKFPRPPLAQLIQKTVVFLSTFQACSGAGWSVGAKERRAVCVCVCYEKSRDLVQQSHNPDVMHIKNAITRRRRFLSTLSRCKREKESGVWGEKAAGIRCRLCATTHLRLCEQINHPLCIALYFHSILGAGKQGDRISTCCWGNPTRGWDQYPTLADSW